MTERRGVPPPPKAESERVAKLIGQQRRQVNQSDESLQKQKTNNFFHTLLYIYRSSNFFTVACLQCWNEHTLPMKSGGFLESFWLLFALTYMAKKIGLFLSVNWLLADHFYIFAIYVHYWLYLNHSRIQYILQCCMLKPWFS